MRCCAFIAVLAVALVCGSHATAGTRPRTWEGRYQASVETLASAKSDADRFYGLREAAKAAFEVGRLDEARRYADELLASAERLPKDWYYGNAIHDGHMVLGRIALRAGAVQDARRELLAAGATPGSPQLDTFGPNMSLARDLLQAGQAEVVIEYFQLCAKFWDHRDYLAQWTSVIRSGGVPEFRANLVY